MWKPSSVDSLYIQSIQKYWHLITSRWEIWQCSFQGESSALIHLLQEIVRPSFEVHSPAHIEHVLHLISRTEPSGRGDEKKICLGFKNSPKHITVFGDTIGLWILKVFPTRTLKSPIPHSLSWFCIAVSPLCQPKHLGGHALKRIEKLTSTKTSNADPC